MRSKLKCDTANPVRCRSNGNAILSIDTNGSRDNSGLPQTNHSDRAIARQLNVHHSTISWEIVRSKITPSVGADRYRGHWEGDLIKGCMNHLSVGSWRFLPAAWPINWVRYGDNEFSLFPAMKDAMAKAAKE